MSRWAKRKPVEPGGLFDGMDEPKAPAQRHSPTSIAAAESVQPHAAALRAKVLEAIQAAGEQGLTDLECQELLSMPGDTQRPRRRELEQAGLIKDSGRTRATRYGKEAVVWVAVEAKQHD